MSVFYARSSEGALRQGEIITDLLQVRLAIDTLEAEQLQIEQISHPFAIVLSQECDLDHDWQTRSSSSQSDVNAAQRLLPSILFAQMTTVEALRSQVAPGRDIRKRIQQNKDERYHVLGAVTREDDSLDEGLPELGIDFKRYFTIPTDEVYRRIQSGAAKRRCHLVSPYVEHLSTRFCYYQFRVALPQEHQIT